MTVGDNIILSQLLAEMPSFHERGGVLQNWHINDKVLHWLDGNIAPGATCLETGAGYSTCVLAARSGDTRGDGSQGESKNGRLTTISPAAGEHQRIADWLGQHDVATGHINFIDDKSQNILPQIASGALDCGTLDFALIDGAHAFPFPMLDWYFAALALRRGGLMMVDDGRIKAVSVLNDFLARERGRWKIADRMDDVIVYEKLVDEVHDPIVDWRSQEYNLRGELRYWVKRTPGLGPLALKLQALLGR